MSRKAALVYLIVYGACSVSAHWFQYHVCSANVGDLKVDQLCGDHQKRECSVCLEVTHEEEDQEQDATNTTTFSGNCGSTCFEDTLTKLTLGTSGCNPTCVYQTCRRNSECGEGYCCLMPTREVLWASPYSECGPSKSCACSTDSYDPCEWKCTPDCGSLATGVCAPNDTPNLPGFSCQYDICQDVNWVHQVCGFDNTTVLATLELWDLEKACSDLCERALDAISHCSGSLYYITKRNQEYRPQYCPNNNGTEIQYCRSNEDCEEELCCSLPMVGWQQQQKRINEDAGECVRIGDHHAEGKACPICSFEYDPSIGSTMICSSVANWLFPTIFFIVFYWQ